jgi:formylglycine-generating enzyme required for sulfatase activity
MRSAMRTGIDSQIESLPSRLHQKSDPAPWIASLPKLTTRSDVINAYWEDWKHVLTTSLGEIARHQDLFHTYQRQTDALQKTLVGLDTNFPPVPGGLDGPFTTAATDYRERQLGKLLATIDPAHPQAVSGGKAIADDYARWCDNLISLSHDFPIRSELLTLGDKPDQTWKQKNPAFWDTPTIQHLVASDLKRLAHLRALAKLGRPDLIDAATESTVPEITFAAWQLLGESAISPPWPSEPGDLDTEKDIRDKLASIMASHTESRAKQVITTALGAQGKTRWRRFVESATSEPMLQQAMDLKNSFGGDSDLFSGLSPEARFNLALYLGRTQMRQSDDRAATPVIAALNKSAQEIPDHKPVQRLLDRLAHIEVKEKFSDQNPGDRFTLAVPGANPPFVFQRVEPPNDRPFYLCTTAVSFGQFAGVIQAANAWEKTAEFAWGVVPGQRDSRRGPRVWEWTQRPPFQMVNPLLWLHPDDDNDYAPPFRIDRFNRTALADDVGGNPSPEHPMQQIPAEAALFYAGLCGCRLPTVSEWRNAYAIFERTVPPERWNLRDQTWDQQRRYAAASTLPNIRWPDEGIFLPEQVTIPMGPDAKARPETDGTLFFRPVNGPGGGTFQELVGNVAQFICEAPDAFDDLQDKSTAAAIRKFLDQTPASVFVIGGSALSPPDVPLQTPLAVVHSDMGYSDVGFRLAFTAPARSLSERLGWVLAGQSYLWARPAPTTATASH